MYFNSFDICHFSFINQRPRAYLCVRGMCGGVCFDKGKKVSNDSYAKKGQPSFGAYGCRGGGLCCCSGRTFMRQRGAFVPDRYSIGNDRTPGHRGIVPERIGWKRRHQSFTWQKWNVMRPAVCRHCGVGCGGLCRCTGPARLFHLHRHQGRQHPVVRRSGRLCGYSMERKP